ncbi:MAG TPA: nuclear transport factor 2 family protein [Rudaea sp.]|jgi:ketosteroid isomerase-like protein|nr:nuclear transport factor 2 family protein [Rudaea sp.]
MRNALLCLILAIPMAHVFAQETDKALAAALKKQADAWDMAIVKKDKKAIAENMSDSFLMIDSGGETSDKARFIADLTSPDITIEPYTVDEFKIRIYGNTALINGATNMHGVESGKPFTTHYRFTDTYVKEGAVWRVVNVQTTRIKQP